MVSKSCTEGCLVGVDSGLCDDDDNKPYHL